MFYSIIFYTTILIILLLQYKEYTILINITPVIRATSIIFPNGRFIEVPYADTTSLLGPQNVGPFRHVPLYYRILKVHKNVY